jgi:Fe-S cluster assembly protein SufD
MATAIKEQHEIYLRRFREFEKQSKAPAWLATIRTEAIEAFAELGFPTTHNEEWKYTNVAPIANAEFEAPAPRQAKDSSAIARRIQSLLNEFDCPRLVFVNGRYDAEFSTPKASGAMISTLAEGLANDSPALEQHLARYADFKTHPFVALNTAFIADGAFIEVPKGTVLGKPLLILHLTLAEGKPVMSHSRSLVLVGRECQATIIECHIGTERPAYFANAVTEVVVDENSVVDYVKVQQESESAFHVATVQFHQARSAIVHATTVDLGSALAREEATSVLDGEGGEATLNGIYVLTGAQHVDNHTTLDHAKPHCASREIYKGILEGKSTGVFNGKIIVRPDAQKTDSKQSNKNLLLSPDATINTKPQLEIWADDVKCTHGATIGRIDAEALFYLRSRGIGIEEARNLLVVAFANDVLDKIKYAPLRERLKSSIFARLARREKQESQAAPGR